MPSTLVGFWSPYLLQPSLLAGWWCADDLTPGLVASWTSRYPNTLTTTAAGTAQPTADAASWNTPTTPLPGVTFDGVANCMVATSFIPPLPPTSSPSEVWSLARNDSLSAGVKQIMNYGSPSAGLQRSISTNDNVQHFRVFDGTVVLAASSSPAFVGANMIGGYWDNTPQEGGRIDGADFLPNATAAIAPLTAGSTRLRIGAGNGTTASAFWAGVIRHIIVTNGPLTTLQRQMLEGYFAWDGWDSAAANPLPANHPYKGGPP
jgi:hypothetical protein